MQRDSLFYRIFQQSPSLLFALLECPPANAHAYQFQSVEVKQTAFRLDGVFLPPDNQPGPVYFCEVQFQPDPTLYERLFSESLLYFYRNRSRVTDWQAVVIYPSRQVEQPETYPFRALLGSDQLHRIYLDELGDLSTLPLGVSLMVLTITPPSQAPQQARLLLERASQEIPEASRREAIVEMITTIMVYMFTGLSRQEVEAMLGTTLQETRVYQEAREEGERIGEQRGLQVGRQEGRLEGRQEGRLEGRQEGRLEGRQEGRLEGRQEGERSLLLRQLTRKFGALSEDQHRQIHQLSLEQLEILAEAFLDFPERAALDQWLTVTLTPPEQEQA